MRDVLVVDDDEAIRGFLSSTLDNGGWHATCIGDSIHLEQHLKSIQDLRLVITDILMPELDGIEIINAIRRLRPGVPIIAMSGGGVGDSSHYLEIALHMGASESLSKPFTHEELLSTIEKAVGTQS